MFKPYLCQYVFTLSHACTYIHAPSLIQCLKFAGCFAQDTNVYLSGASLVLLYSTLLP